MQFLKLKTNVHEAPNFAAFAADFSLGSRDLVLTNRFIYEPYMQSLGLSCRYIFQEEYGSGEPSDEMIDAIMVEAQKGEFDRIIAVGGGTIIDISKILSLGKVGRTRDAFERKIPLQRAKKLVIVPTTAGTGSEVTNISIAEIKSKGTKLGLADDIIAADDAVLIPELMRSLPYRFWAAASIDALIHAIEAWVSPKANPYSKLFSKSAIETIIKVFKAVAKDPEARHQYAQEMLIAANMAGIAFGNVGVGAVHALSYPLGGKYHVPHGEANYQVFTEVFKTYRAKRQGGALAEVETLLAALLETTPNDVYVHLDQLMGSLIARTALKEYGMQYDECHTFAVEVLKQQQRLLANNWVELSQEEIESIYINLY